MTTEEFRQAPAFARMCIVQLEYPRIPVEATPPRPKYNRRPEVPLRTRVMPLFVSGEALTVQDILQALPGVKRHRVATVLRRGWEADELVREGQAWKRGPRYPS